MGEKTASAASNGAGGQSGRGPMRGTVDRVGEVPRPAVRVLPWWAYTLSAAVAVALMGLAVWWLLAEAGGDAKLRIEAIRTGLTVGLGAGGAFALLINARRQWLQERAHNHQTAVNAAAEHDAAERRITELYNAAAEQLGSDKAPVRLTALYTLERLADDNERHRQTIVNIICAYLRMPFTPPAAAGPEEEHRERARRSAARYRAARQGRPEPAQPLPGPDPHEELQVRLTAQRLLHTHLQPDAAVHWGEISLDLTGATLTNFTLTGCRLNTADFSSTTFTRNAWFNQATFTGNAVFSEAIFTGNAWFNKATFTGNAVFSKATFTGNARFNQATFTGDAWFSEATFTGDARFDEATFTRTAVFSEATFTGDAGFDKATFTGDAWFSVATFTGNAGFSKATFTRDAVFSEATFTGDARFDKATFTRTAEFSKATFTETARFDKATFTRTAGFHKATFTETAGFDEATFTGDAWFSVATFTGNAGFSKATFSRGVDLEAATVADVRLVHQIPAGWEIQPVGGTGGRFVQAGTSPSSGS
ncbi:pentapeptide repeat-containing protein [Actinomadura litoris]|nr:pentapeptide repeat-containing protein [Actinomadura litoris]